MTEFEKACVAEAKRIQHQLSLADDVTRFEFEMKAEGRVVGGEILITFSIGANYDPDVKGKSVDAVLHEAMRRNGWTRDNQPLCIGYAE